MVALNLQYIVELVTQQLRRTVSAIYIYIVGSLAIGESNRLTSIGLNNSGSLIYDIDVEMGDVGVFNTTGSKLWTRVQLLFKNELAEQYAIMRQKQFTVDNMMKYIVDEQISQIPGKYYNIDMTTKYLNYGSSYLYALHGSGYHHIRKWLRERLIYCDTLFGYNVSTSDYITLRANKLGEVYLDIQTYIPMYVRIKFRDESNSSGIQVKRVARGETVRFSYSLPTATDQEIIVYAGHYLKSLGDVSNLNPSTMLIANADRLTEITCHSPNLINTDLSECTMLQRIDLSDSTALGTGIGAQPILNIQNCKYLRYCNCMNTQLTAIYTMQQGGNLEELYFPETTQVIQVTNQTYLHTIGIPCGYKDLLYQVKEYYTGMNYEYWGTSYNQPTIKEDSSIISTRTKLKVEYGTEYTLWFGSNIGEAFIWEFDSNGNTIDRLICYILAYGSVKGTYKPTSSSVAYICINFRVVPEHWRFLKDNVRLCKTSEIDYFMSCKNLATVQITNCNALRYTQYPIRYIDSLKFGAFTYVQNLTVINSMPTLTNMSFKGFNKLRNVTLQNLQNLTTLGFDNMLGASDVSALKNITLSNMPKVTKLTFNVDSAEYKIEFAGNGKFDIGGLRTLTTIESNYSIKGLDTIILPTSIKELKFSTTYGDGINEIKNLWSSTSNHASDGFTGIDFQDMTISYIDMLGLSQVLNAINFNIVPTTQPPNLNTNKDGTDIKPWFKPTGSIDLNNYTGSMVGLLKGIDLSKLNVILDIDRPQTNLTSLFESATIGGIDFTKINYILSKFPSSTVWDYMFAYSDVAASELTLGNNCTSIKYCFANCLGLVSFVLNNYKATSMEGIFKNATNLTNLTINGVANSYTNNMQYFNIGNSILTDILLNNISINSGGNTTSIFDSSNLTVSSLVNLISALSSSGNSQVFQLGNTNLTKLTTEQKAIAINKGWTLA